MEISEDINILLLMIAWRLGRVVFLCFLELDAETSLSGRRLVAVQAGYRLFSGFSSRQFRGFPIETGSPVVYPASVFAGEFPGAVFSRLRWRAEAIESVTLPSGRVMGPASPSPSFSLFNHEGIRFA